jgi:hypothetical protein
MDIVERVVEERRPRSLVEVGPGMGAAGWLLAQKVDVYTAYEPDVPAFRVAQSRMANVDGARVFNDYLPSQPDRTYDGLVAFEVLEHIESDEDELARWTEWVEPGGFVMISVPAKQRRFGPWDEAVGHFRRYDRDALSTLMRSVGLVDLDIRSYGMPLGYLLETVRQRLLAKRMRPEQEITSRTGRSGRSFQPTSHGSLIRGLTVPFVLAQRPFERTDWGIGWVASGTKAAP